MGSEPEDVDGRWEGRALAALSEQLGESGAHFELVIIGGAALIWLGLLDRATKDVDVVGLVSGSEVISSKPFPDELARAVTQVAAALDLPDDWLFGDRFDQIHFKLYAMVDHGGGRHAEDLRALDPAREELIAAARWTTTHDPSEGFRGQLVLALAEFGVRDVDIG